MLAKIPADLRDRVMDALVRKLGGRDEVNRPGILTGPRDSDRMQIILRRRSRQEREADPSLSQFQEIAAISALEIDKIIADSLNEPQAVDNLLQRITNGRDVLKELKPEHADLIRSFLARAIPEEINKLVAEAQAKKAAEAAAAAQSDPKTEELKAQPVPKEVSEMVKQEILKPTHGEPVDPEQDLVQWGIAHNFTPQYDKRGKGTALKKSWLAVVQKARDQWEQNERDQAERQRQRMLQGA